MLADHREIERLWAQLAPALAALQAGQAIQLEAWQADAHAFIAVHAGHIALENTIAFPAVRAALGPAATQAMGTEMAARRRAS
jgi:hemerythrin-like domain-containing protein